MKYRHEYKQLIPPKEAELLIKRLGAVMPRDGHDGGAGYIVTSLYFDSFDDRALREKLSGVNMREKFRLRVYDGCFDEVWLEKKSKINGLCSKSRCTVSQAEAQRIITLGALYTPQEKPPLLAELSGKMASQALRPKTIIEYRRRAFVFPAGNVRVTLDGDIRTGLGCTDFFDADRLTIPARETATVLEVKWDEFLPDVIRGLVQPGCARTESFSKYAAGRVYG